MTILKSAFKINLFMDRRREVLSLLPPLVNIIRITLITTKVNTLSEKSRRRLEMSQ